MQQKELACSAVLAIVCIYSLVTKSLEGPYGIIADIMFLVTGLLAAVIAGMEGSQNNHSLMDQVKTAYGHAFFVSRVAALDFFMVEVCLQNNVDHTLALVNLVPPAIDIVEKYFLDENWKLLTPTSHIVSGILMIYLGFKNEKYVLLMAAAGFLLAVTHYAHREMDIAITHVLNAIGVFFVGWSLAGKDLAELGITSPVSELRK